MKTVNYAMISVMVKNTFRLLWLSLLFCFATVQADISFPKKQGGVTDQTGILSSQSSKQINDKILLLKKTQGSQIAVLIIPTTAPLTIEQYANQLFNQWRLGHYMIDDGVLLLVALDDRAVRIEVGYGLEGTLTDLESKNILNEYLLPYFKQERYEQGIELAVDALIAKIKQESLPPIDHTQLYIAKNPDDFGMIDIISAIILGSSFCMWMAFLYKLLKASPLKVGIFLVIILSITGYFGGFDINTWNGLELGDGFFKNNLPYWVQVLLLKILPSWMSVVMILNMFIVSFILCLGLFTIPFFIMIKCIKSAKLLQSMMTGIFFGIIVGMMSGFQFESSTIGIVIGTVTAILIGIGIYTGKIKSVDSSSEGQRDSSIEVGSSYKRDSSIEVGSSYSSSSSSSDDSGGGGRSGGGGASGSW